MIKNIFGSIKNLFTANNDNNGTTANVTNNANGTTTDGQSNNNNANGTTTDGTTTNGSGTGTANVNPVTVGTTPELRDGNGIVSPTTFADTANELANKLADCKFFVKLYTEQLADTTDVLAVATVRDRLTFWQNERQTADGTLSTLTDEQRQTVGQLFTARLAVLNNDPDTTARQDTKSAVFALNNAKKRCEDQKSVVKSANDDAKSARDNATAQRDELNKQRLNVSRLAVQSGTATADDLSLLARQDVTDNATDVLSSVATKLFGKRANGNKLLKNATDKIRSLSNIVKSVKKNFTDFLPFFNLYDVPVSVDDVTVKVVKSENVHPFMLIPTADGLKVCDPVTVGRSLSPLTRWNEEKFCQLVVLNHYLKLENVSDDRLKLHVQLLTSAVDALQTARDKKNAASLTNDRIKELTDRLAVLADPEKTSDNDFSVSLYVQLTNELADEKNKLREQLAEQRQSEKNANDAKSDVLNDKKSDDVKNVLKNARTERDNANGSTTPTTDVQDNGQTANVPDVQTPTTDVQDNGQTANVPDVQTPTTADVQDVTTPTTRRRSGSTKNGTKSNGTKSGRKNGTTGRRTTTAARQNVVTDNGTTASRSRKKVVNG